MAVIIFVAGVFAGVVSLYNLEIQKTKELVDYFSSSVGDAPFKEVLKSCAIINGKYILLYFVTSLTIYISVLSPFILGIKGFSLGFTSAFLITNYGANGIVYTLLAIFPSTLLSFPLYAFASVVCINFALGRRKRMEKGAVGAIKIILSLFIIYIAITVCSLYDVIISTIIFKQLF